MTDITSDNITTDMSFEPEPVSPYDPQDASNRRAMLLLAATFGGLLLLAWAVYSLYNDGTRDRSDVPFYASEDTDFKERPVDAGGAQVEGQDREVLNANGEPVSVTERPRTEEPMDPLTDTMQVEVEPVTPSITPEPQPEPKPEPKPEPVVAQVAEPTPDPVPVRPVTPEPVAPTPAPATPAPATVAGGSSDWVVQVSAHRTQEAANADFTKVSGRFSGVIPSSAYADIQRADLGDKGIYFRTRVAGLADKAAANRLCAAFKASNQSCLVKRR